ncbi:glycosyltransferase [Psychrobacter alimentarius]|uniref:glycosyltransferase n=1 Tax=Psychrobacter alimentarius TaxID=261164 RepID=UPI003FD65B24
MNYIAKNIYFVTNNMPRKHGGRTKSMLQRARILTSSLSNNVYILTTKHNNDYYLTWEDFKKRGLIDEKIHYINIYDDLMANKYSREENNVITRLLSLDVFNSKCFSNILNILQNAFRNQETEISKSFILEGYSLCLKYKYLTSDNIEKKIYSIKVISRVASLEIFIDSMNNVIRECGYNNSGELLSELFFDKAGIEYLHKRYTHKSGSRKLIDITYRNGVYSNSEVKIFKSYHQFYTFWFENVIPCNSFIINDVRTFDRPLSNVDMKKKNMYLVCLFHNSHKMSKSYNYVIENYEKVNKIVTLTTKQYKDLENHLPSSKLFTIPHSIEVPQLQSNDERHNLIVVARLAKQKQLNHILKAFQLVSLKNSEVILDIYGHGEEEIYLKEMTVNLGIQNKVIFHGSIENVASVFRTAKCSVVSSLFEGFGLVIQESMANGCPVVSYDIDYGPSDMIKDGVNGFLIEKQNINELAQKLEFIVSNKYVFDEEKVQKSIVKFSHPNFLKNWLYLLEDSINNN